MRLPVLQIVFTCCSALLCTSFALPTRRKRQADFSSLTNLFTQAFQNNGGSGGLLGSLGGGNLLKNLGGGTGGGNNLFSGLGVPGGSGGDGFSSLLGGDQNAAAAQFLKSVQEMMKGFDFGKFFRGFFGGGQNGGGGGLGGFESLFGAPPTPSPPPPPPPPPTTTTRPTTRAVDPGSNPLLGQDLSGLNLGDTQALLKLLGGANLGSASANAQKLPSPEQVLARLTGGSSFFAQLDAERETEFREADRRTVEQEGRFFREVHGGLIQGSK